MSAWYASDRQSSELSDRSPMWLCRRDRLSPSNLQVPCSWVNRVRLSISGDSILHVCPWKNSSWPMPSYLLLSSYLSSFTVWNHDKTGIIPGEATVIGSSQADRSKVLNSRGYIVYATWLNDNVVLTSDSDGCLTSYKLEWRLTRFKKIK